MVFVSVASFLYTCSALPPLGNSDHNGLQLVVKAKGVRRKREGTRFLWNYSQGDYAKASHMINSTNWDMLFSTDINSSLLNWQNQFLHIMEECMANTKNTNSDKEEKQSIQNLEKKRFYYVTQKIYSCSEHSPQITEVCKEKLLHTSDQKLFFHTLTSSSLSVVHGTGKAFTSQEKADILSVFSGSVSTRLFLL